MQRVRTAFGMPASHIEIPGIQPHPHLLSSPLMHLGGKKDGLNAEVPVTHVRDGVTWLLASALYSFIYCRHLESKSSDRRDLPNYPSIYLSPVEIN